MHHDAGELGAALDLATRVEEIAIKHGFPFWLAVAMVVRGRSAFARGEVDAGLGRINEGLGLFRAIGAKTPYPYYLSYLVEALLEAGRIDEAVRAVDEALAMTKRNVDRCFRPELFRLKGEAMARIGDAAAARWCYRLARALSRVQYARLFELKTAAEPGSGPPAGEGRRRKRAPTVELEV
jgi:tetratricopeptide (TPR) repeat protein